MYNAYIFVTARMLTWGNIPQKNQLNESLVYFPSLKNNWYSKCSSSQRVFCEITMVGHYWNATLSIQLKPNLKRAQRSAEKLVYKLIIWLSCKEYFCIPLLPIRISECTWSPFQPVIPWLSLLHLTLSHASLKAQSFRRHKAYLHWRVEERDTHRALHKSLCFIIPKSIQMGNEECLCQLQFLWAVDSLQHKYRTHYLHQESKSEN